MPYIDAISKLMLIAVFVFAFFLQGCANLKKKDTNHAEKLEVLGKDIVEMVDISVSEKALTEDENIIDAKPSKGNLYLVQAHQRLKGVPENIILEYEQALELIKLNKWQEAEDVLDHIIVTQPQLSGAYVNKALIAFQRQKLTQGDAYLDQALIVNPINPYAYQLKAQVSRLYGRFGRSRKLLS